MVCNRCISAVKTALENLGLRPVNIKLGEVDIAEEEISPSLLTIVDSSLKEIGFELIDDSKKRIVEKIKNVVINIVHHDLQVNKLKHSELITNEVHYDYPYLSNLFSAQEGITIEQYIIQQKVEKIKEYIAYDELRLGEIADRMGYSSIAHLSAQFKKVTGMPPSQFKAAGVHQRKPLDKVGKR